MASMEQVHVKLLGEFAFSTPGGEWIRWRANKARSLFGVLLVNKNIVVGKDRLRELLWPDVDRPSTSLKVAVHALRKVLDTHLGRIGTTCGSSTGTSATRSRSAAM